MQFFLVVLTTWIVVMVLGLIPKRLSEMEMVILFFVHSIFAISVFTIIELNLRWIIVSGHTDRVFGILVGHIVQVPLVMIIISNVALYASVFRWGMIVAIWILLVMMQLCLKWVGVLYFIHWSFLYSCLEFAALTGFSILAAGLLKWISKVGGRKLGCL